MDLKPGDEVEFDYRTIECVNCKETSMIVYPDSHFFWVQNGRPQGVLCANCADSADKRKVPLGMMQPIIEDTQLPLPISGSFKPVIRKPDPQETSVYEYWRQIGHNFLETFVLWQEKVMKFSLGGNRYKGIWIKPHWESTRVIGLAIAGDTPSKGLELDVYQLSRLRKLGFVEGGQSNKTWSIQLNPEEGTIENVSALILHLIRHGYLLEPTDLNTITPTLDIDLDDPEYSDLK